MAILEDQKGLENRYSQRGRYKHSFIIEIVREVEEGLDIREACKRYHLQGRRLHEWLDKYSSPSYSRPKLFCYSAVQKKSICRAIAQGKLTVQEAVTTYQVHSSTIYWWQKQEKHELDFSKDHVLKKSTKASNVTPPAEDGGDEIKRLQQQLADANLKIAALNTLIDVAEEQLKINIRKKPGAKQS
ncbi:MAG: transposase [Chitinophagaceae bacterium]|nr:transposase [Chitinophagaceae bacterium]